MTGRRRTAHNRRRESPPCLLVALLGGAPAASGGLGRGEEPAGVRQVQQSERARAHVRARGDGGRGDRSGDGLRDGLRGPETGGRGERHSTGGQKALEFRRGFPLGRQPHGREHRRRHLAAARVEGVAGAAGPRDARRDGEEPRRVRGRETMSSAAPRRLARSSRYKMIAGVCGGVAEYFQLDPTLVRVAYVIVSIISAAFPGILAYIILMFVMPRPEPQQGP